MSDGSINGDFVWRRDEQIELAELATGSNDGRAMSKGHLGRGLIVLTLFILMRDHGGDHRLEGDRLNFEFHIPYAIGQLDHEYFSRGVTRAVLHWHAAGIVVSEICRIM
jgi:hypothetical protein